jgi:hypothetical protein
MHPSNAPIFFLLNAKPALSLSQVVINSFLRRMIQQFSDSITRQIMPCATSDIYTIAVVEFNNTVPIIIPIIITAIISIGRSPKDGVVKTTGRTHPWLLAMYIQVTTTRGIGREEIGERERDKLADY